MSLADEHQLPLLADAFDEDELPNEHPITSVMLQRKLLNSRKK